MEAIRQRIANQLAGIDNYGTIKLYLCFYEGATLYEIIQIIRDTVTFPCVIRHNVMYINEVPAGLLLGEEQDPITQFVEVSKVYKMDSFTHTSRCD